jgi:hypothetical protein
MSEQMVVRVKIVSDDLSQELNKFSKSIGSAFKSSSPSKDGKDDKDSYKGNGGIWNQIGKDRSFQMKNLKYNEELANFGKVKLPPPPEAREIPPPPLEQKKGMGVMGDLLKSIMPKSLSGIFGGKDSGAGGGGAVKAGAVGGAVAGGILAVVGIIKDGIKGILEIIVKTSPILQATLQMFQTLVGLLFMPLATLVSAFLLPIAAFMMILLVPILRAVMPHITQLMAFMMQFATAFGNLIVPFITLAMGMLNPIMGFVTTLLKVVGTVVLASLFGLVIGIIGTVITTVMIAYFGIAGILNGIILGVKLVFGAIHFLYDGLIDGIARPILNFFGMGSLADMLKAAGDKVFGDIDKALKSLELPTGDIFKGISEAIGQSNVELARNSLITSVNSDAMNGMAVTLAKSGLSPEAIQKAVDIITDAAKYSIADYGSGKNVSSSDEIKQNANKYSEMDDGSGKNISDADSGGSNGDSGSVLAKLSDALKNAMKYSMMDSGSGKNIQAMNSGGYTGNKSMVAMLHPNEWVLNKEQMQGLLSSGISSNQSGTNYQNMTIQVGGITINGGVGGLSIEKIKDAVNDGIANAVRRRRSR